MNITTGTIKSLEWWGDATLARQLVILIAGKAGVGKTTFATILSNEIAESVNLSVNIFSFADSVKACAKDYFSWDGIKDDRGRKLLQSIGNTGREYDVDTWARIFLNSFILNDVAIVDDWRFPNEYNYLVERDIDVITVKINAPTREILKDDLVAYNDISEIALDNSDIPIDLEFYNDKNMTMKNLDEMAKLFVEKYLKGGKKW